MFIRSQPPLAFLFAYPTRTTHQRKLAAVRCAFTCLSRHPRFPRYTPAATAFLFTRPALPASRSPQQSSRSPRNTPAATAFLFTHPALPASRAPKQSNRSPAPCRQQASFTPLAHLPASVRNNYQQESSKKSKLSLNFCLIYSEI